MDALTQLKIVLPKHDWSAFDACRDRQTEETLRGAKRLRNTLLRDFHPDRGGSDEICAYINDAYAYVSGQAEPGTQAHSVATTTPPGADTAIHFAFDVSSSMIYGFVANGLTRLDAAKRAAKALGNTFSETAPHSVAFLGPFADEGHLWNIAGWHAWDDSVDALEAWGSRTNITDALRRACDTLCSWQGSKYANRRLLLLSDGSHNAPSNVAPLDMAQHLKDQGVIIHTRGFARSPSDSSFDEYTLKRIASTGPDGQPLYRFHSEAETLLLDFRQLPQQMLLLDFARAKRSTLWERLRTPRSR